MRPSWASASIEHGAEGEEAVSPAAEFFGSVTVSPKMNSDVWRQFCTPGGGEAASSDWFYRCKLCKKVGHMSFLRALRGQGQSLPPASPCIISEWLDVHIPLLASGPLVAIPDKWNQM